MRKFLLAIPAILLLSACANDTVKETTVIDTPVLNPNMPTKMHLENVQFGSMPDPNAKDGSYVITLTKTEFNKLSGNIVEMQRYIKQLQETVRYYKAKPTVSK